MKQFIITKKIAKHGKQAVIVIPTILQEDLKPKTIVKLTIDILKDAKDSEMSEITTRNPPPLARSKRMISEHAQKPKVFDSSKKSEVKNG